MHPLMNRFSIDLRQRRQHKPALVHRRMRHLQSRLVNHLIAEQQNVYVYLAWPLWRCCIALASHAALNLQQTAHQLLRRFLCVQFDSAIQEPRLRGELDRLGLIKRRNFADIAQLRQPMQRLTQVRLAVTHVRAQR